MKNIMKIHLTTGDQDVHGSNIAIIPRLGENIKNHDGAFETVKDITYAYLKEGLVIHVYT